MLKRLRNLSVKKKLVTGAFIVAVAAGGVTAALNQPQTTGADTSPLTTEVDRQGQQLNNHEARITNTENDVKDLQNHTNTPPSTTRVLVPGANTTQTITSTPSAPAPAPAPAPVPPVTVTGASQQVAFAGSGQPANITCELTYSDGTSKSVPANESDTCQEYLGQVKG